MLLFQQDLWRHVVPKKRPTGENRPIIPAANLLPPSVHAEASKAAGDTFIALAPKERNSSNSRNIRFQSVELFRGLQVRKVSDE